DYFAKYNKKFVGISRNTGVSIPLPMASAAPSISPGINNGIASGIVDPAGLINFSQIIQNVATGTNLYVAAGNYLAAIVHLLEQTNRFRILSRPTVLDRKSTRLNSSHVSISYAVFCL